MVIKYNLTNDILFKLFFGKEGNEEITKALLKSILKKEITSIDLSLNRELNIDNIMEKRGIVDIRAKIDEKIECIVEMQVIDQKNIEKRILYYWSNMYSKQQIRGKDYSKLNKVIAIVIADFKLKKLDGYVKYHTTWKITEEKDVRQILTDDLEIHIIEIPKIMRRNIEEKDELIEWLKFIKNPESEEVKEIMKTNVAIRDASKKLTTYTQEEIEAYREVKRKMVEIDRMCEMNELRKKIIAQERRKAKKEGIKRGKTIGITEGKMIGITEGKMIGITEGKTIGITEGKMIGKKEGEQLEKIKVAKNMLEMGIEINVIEKVTKLSKGEIEKLKI